MKRKLVTAATSYPLTLAEVKDHLRVDQDLEDQLIESLIGAATEAVEGLVHRPLVNSTWTHYFDRFPGELSYELQPGVSSITSITYLDENNVEQTLAASVYELSEDWVPMFRLAPDQDWPDVLDHPDSVRVTVVSGFGADRHAVPDNIKAAMKLMISHWYENREAVTPGSLNELPVAVNMLLNRYWIPSL
jgi:uncharacterized phiE125 gp8 family phage protein